MPNSEQAAEGNRSPPDVRLNIHAIITGSRVNGPGDRVVVWTQGCGKGCKGCFNVETWDTGHRSLYHPEHAAALVLQSGMDGLTLTGGDPLEQPEAILLFLKALHDGSGNLIGFPRGIICFTGYTMDEVNAIPPAAACLPYIDLLIDGRFVESLRHTSGIAGSSNQNFNFSTRAGRGRDIIPEDEVKTDQGVEVFGGEDGTVEVTGFPAIDRKRLGMLGLKVVK